MPKILLFSCLLISVLCIRCFWSVCSPELPASCICARDDLANGTISCLNGGFNIPSTWNIEAIPEDTESLTITGSTEKMNSISLKEDTFKGKHFSDLHLSFFNFSGVSPLTFLEHLKKSLRILNLRSNSLTSIEQNDLFCPKLVRLHLEQNRISRLENYLFAISDQLEFLSLSGNDVTFIAPYAFGKLTKLKFLDLSFNPHLPSLDDQWIFSALPSLRSLNLTKTGLVVVPWEKMSTYCTYLEELDLSNNKIFQINRGQVSRLKLLKTLDLSGNPIQFIAPAAFAGLSFDRLRLSRLPCDALQPGTFASTRIRHLELSDMNLTTINENIFLPDINTSQSKDVGNSSVAVIDVDFSPDPVSRLLHLDLSRNRLTAVPAWLLSRLNTELRTIDLSDNQITSVDGIISNFTANSSNLEAVHLHGNPLHCSCNVSDLVNLSEFPNGFSVFCRNNNKNNNESQLDCPLCMTPAPLLGLSIDNFTNNRHLFCPELSSKNPANIGNKMSVFQARSDAVVENEPSAASRTKILQIALGVTVPVASIVFLALAVMFCVRRRKRKEDYSLQTLRQTEGTRECRDQSVALEPLTSL